MAASFLANSTGVTLAVGNSYVSSSLSSVLLCKWHTVFKSTSVCYV